MTSREQILNRVKTNQAAASKLPDFSVFKKHTPGSVEKFKAVLESIGGRVIEINSVDEIQAKLSQLIAGKRVVKTMAALPFGESVDANVDPHELENVEVAILEGTLAVEENGAIWLTEEQMVIRALPFICQHLAIVLRKHAVVPGMWEAYQVIEAMNYSFGTFLAGPSKTADIEQSLVLGAHGARTLTVFLI